MQERTVLVLVVVLVVSTAAAGVAVNLFRPNDSDAWRAFNLSVGTNLTGAVGSSLRITVSVRQGMLDPRTLPLVFLSLDLGTMQLTSATAAANPWGYPTVWNLTGLDLSSPRYYNATVLPTDAGTAVVYAMIWVPRGDLGSVPIDANGHVNPAGFPLETVASHSVDVTA